MSVDSSQKKKNANPSNGIHNVKIKKELKETKIKKESKTKANEVKKGMGKKIVKATIKSKKVKEEKDGSDDDEDDSKEEKVIEEEKQIPKLTVADRYRKKTLLESILLRPDTYVDSVEPEKDVMWVYDDEINAMVYKQITYVKGLFKIFDEILVNAADHRHRSKLLTEIRVTIDKETGRITVWNNGDGVEIAMHPEYKCYVPELLFGQLLTGENYNDLEQRIVGGRNGYGAKLANIFSTEFSVETNDTIHGKYYKQGWTGGMMNVTLPEIKEQKKGGGFTKISFIPDYSKFGMEGLDDDSISLFNRRTRDIAGTCSTIKVWFNETEVTIKPPSRGASKGATFETYARQFLPQNSVVASSRTERWDVIALAKSGEDGFNQVSFTNAIHTSKGGTHVNYVVDKITKAIIQQLKKKKKGIKVTPSQVKAQLTVFVNATIVNPRFDSQTKTCLITKQPSFGSSWEVDDAFLKQLSKTALVERILEDVEAKEWRALKKSDGKSAVKGKGGRISGIPKLEDANDAGGKHRSDCTLIVTEGDSAKALAMAGLSIVGRNRYGVFPLRGKLLNVRTAKPEQIKNNKEINHIKMILGLKVGETYLDTSKLRYGHLMIMADQDHDGSHIKGLVINLFAHSWPSLLKLPGFLCEFVTPIVKVSKGKVSQVFFTIPEYEKWKVEIQGGEEKKSPKGWKIKYYKGLGTSTPQEAKDYFREIERHRISFTYTGQEDDKKIHMAFAKKQEEARKAWIGDFVPGTYLDQNVDEVSYSDFVDKELILFSIESNVRAIPSVVDGFKPGQRKIIYSCFKRDLKKEIKVAQLAGYVSEHSSYHHAEDALGKTIIGLAQNFTGNNNINLLYPNGQFGTRAEGGADAASVRYTFTHLCPITRLLFHIDDDVLLRYLDDDGQLIEPEWYIPVIPLALVNSNSGIGTGFATKLTSYNPRVIAAIVRRMIILDQNESKLDSIKKGDAPKEEEDTKKELDGEEHINAPHNAGENDGKAEGEMEEKEQGPKDDEHHIPKTNEKEEKETETELVPFVKGFLGEIVPGKKAGTYISRGIITRESDTSLRITELPVKVWTTTYRTDVLEDLIKTSQILSFKEHHTDVTVDFIVNVTPDQMTALETKTLHKAFSLTSDISTNNMMFFDPQGRLARYTTPQAVIDEWFPVRKRFYGLRKTHLEQLNDAQVKRISNRLRFVTMVTAEEIHIKNAKKKDIEAQLESLGFDRLVKKDITNRFPIASRDQEDDDDDDAEDDMEDDDHGDEKESKTEKKEEKKEGRKEKNRASFDYLLSMPLSSLSWELMEKLKKEHGDKTYERDILRNTTCAQMWIRDLDNFLIGLDAHEERERLQLLAAPKSNIKSGRKRSLSTKPIVPSRKGGKDVKSKLKNGSKRKPEEIEDEEDDIRDKRRKVLT